MKQGVDHGFPLAFTKTSGKNRPGAGQGGLCAKASTAIYSATYGTAAKK